jgi:catechol 2,3-dioxygenase-like lactoylglutathione lyase family enzyme
LTSFRLQRLDHVSLNTSDRARSIAWYRDVLGLEQRNEPQADDWPVFMGAFGACVGLFQAQTESPPREPESTGLRHVAFMLEGAEFERARAELAAAGVEVRFEDHGTAHSLYLRDPDGHTLELTTYEPPQQAAAIRSLRDSGPS